MKTVLHGSGEQAAPIVALLDVDPAAQDTSAPVLRARAFAEPLLAGQPLDTGEEALDHADGVAAILAGIGAAPALQAASYLVYAGDFLNKPEEIVSKAFGESYASLVTTTRRLVQVQRAAREAQAQARQTDSIPSSAHEQTERVRKMLLAFSRDLRVVLLRLASRLQTLRYFAAGKQSCPRRLAAESLQVFAPLANRLGIWQIKWELEDLAFRFMQPERYRELATPCRKPGSSASRGLKPCGLNCRPTLSPTASQPPCRADPNTSTASTRRCAARRWRWRRCLTCVRCALWCPRWPIAMPR